MNDKINILDIITLIISFLAFAFSIWSMYRSEKYTKIDISNEYRNSLLDWFKRCLEIMEFIRRCDKNEPERLVSLSKFAALINEGRFYFPNIEKNNFANDNPDGFRGYRCTILNYLVLYLKLFENNREVDNNDIGYIIKNFTSEFFVFMNPPKFISKLSKTLKDSYNTKLRYKDSDKHIFVLAERYSVQI